MAERRVREIQSLARRLNGDDMAVGLGGLQQAASLVAGLLAGTSATAAGAHEAVVPDLPARHKLKAAASARILPGEHWFGEYAPATRPASGSRGAAQSSAGAALHTPSMLTASFQFLATGDAASIVAPVPPPALAGIPEMPAPLAIKGVRAPDIVSHAAGQAANMPSPTQRIDFTMKQAAPITTLGSLSYSLPGAFYQSFSKSLSYGADGFNAYANVDLAGGIKGGFTLSFGSILPNYPLMLNAETVGSVADGNVFTVTPTLISTDDAFFKLGLPTADVHATYGLKLQGGVGLSFPSVSVGIGPFSYSFGPPSIYKSIVDINDIQSLATSKTENFNGGYATLSELTGGIYKSATIYQKYGLPTITETAYTQPFLKAQFDPLAAIGAYIPELKALDGSEDFGVGNASWSLLSLPINASLEIANQITLTETGFNVTLSERMGGTTKALGTHPVTVGTSQGYQWNLTAPSKGAGVMNFTLTYALTLSVQSAISLFGSFGITLDGPQASLDILGHSLSVSPLFSIPLVNESGDLFTYDLPSTVETLTAVQHDQVFYGPIAAEQTLVSNLYMHYEMKAGGERFKIASGVVIAPETNTVGPTIGVEGTLGAAAVYNYGSIYPYALNGSVLDSSIGINLPGGGKVINAGNIDYGRSGQFFQGAIRYGIEIGGYGSTVINSGNIVGDVWAGIDIAGTAASAAYVLNTQTGTLLATGFYGILAKGPELEVINQGKIQLGGGRFGVYGQTGLFLDNSGFITASDLSGGSHIIASADVYSGGKSASYVNNEGAIGIYTGANAGQSAFALAGVYLGDGIIVNSGTIAGAEFGVYIGRNGSAVVENAGLIEATGKNAADAVRMFGSTNELILDPGARFNGAVYAFSSAGAANNSFVLNAGSLLGTLNMTGGAHYTGFGEINIFPAASWVLETTQPVNFYGATIAGLTGEDLIEIKGLAYTAGESVSLATSTDILTLKGSNGSILEQVHLSGNLAGADFHVRGNNGNTYIRAFNGNFTDIINGAIGAQTINANSYYGGKLTVASGASVSYNAQGGSSIFGLDLQAVTSTSKSTIGGTTTVSTSVAAAALTNFGTITGNGQGVFLQSPGRIYNRAGAQISGHTYGIEEKANYAGVFIGNSGSISGGETGIYLAGGGTIVNLGSVYGAGTGLATKNAAAIYNAGTIRGAQSEGISMAAGAVTNVASGVVTSAGTGIYATGSAVNVTNSGAISGRIGIDLSAGGGVTNTAAAGAGGTELLGTITGTVYAVQVSGGAGQILNQVNGLARLPELGIIEGISLAAGGLVANGADGEIISSRGAYAINLGSGGAATVANNGIVGKIFAGGPDRIMNGLSGTIQSILAASGAPVTVQNHGTIGNATIATAISESGQSFIYNVGGAGTIATIEGHIGIILSAAGLIDNGASGLIEGLAGSGIRLLAGGSIENAGRITATGGGAGIYMNGGTLTDLGLISGTNGAAALAFGTTAATVIIDPGAAFIGAVTGNGKNDILQLGGTGLGTLSGIGTEITGFKTNTVLAGSDWSLAGTNTLAGYWTVAGTLSSGQESSAIYDGLLVKGVVTVTGHLEGQNASRGAAGGGATGVDLLSGKIANSGTIAGGYGALSGYSADGADVSGGTLENSGLVEGGSYSFAAGSGAGGNGVELAASGVLTNSGLILGGATGSFYGSYGPGGAGVLLAGPGTATNTGTIIGGAGAYTGGKGAVVGAGQLTNNRQITGGYGRSSGGAGAYVSGGTLTNAGTITGGGASGTAGFGALIASGTLANTGLILAGKAGSGAGIGVELIGGTLINAGTISGANGGAAVQFGTATASLELDPGAVFNGKVVAVSTAGDALDLTGSGHGTLSGLGSQFTGFGVLAETAGASWTIAGTNSFAGLVTASGLLTIGGTLTATGSWTVSGTVDAAGSLATGGVIAGAYGVTALNLQSGVLVNSGTLAGGGGHYDFSTQTGVNGGIGLAQSGGSGTNKGLIAGGNGVVSDGGLPGYVGGVGVSLSAGTLTNAGRIQGGAGNYSDNGAGNGGAGVSLLGGTLVNTGTIQGGAGGYGDAMYSIAPGNGGAGVYLDGGTLVTSGAIAGGAGGPLLGGSPNGAAGDAVLFGAQAATLILDPGASFGGAVAANTAVKDVLELAGTAAATLSGLGTQFSGFSSFVETAGAQWTLSGRNSFAGAMSIAGTLSDAGTLSIGGALSGTGKLVVASGGTLSGTGTIGVALNDLGLVEAAGGTLVESGAVSGTGLLEAEAGATLDIATSSTLGGKLSGAGTIALTVAGTLASGAQLNAGAFLQKATLTLAPGENLTPGGKSYVIETSSATATTALSGTSANLFTNNATLLEKGSGTSEILVSLKNNKIMEAQSGTFSLLGTVTNAGTLSAVGGALVVAQTVGGTGTLDIGNASLLWLKNGASAGQTASFASTGGTLELGAPKTFAGHILDFGAPDVIELAATAATKVIYNGGVLTVENGTLTVASLSFSGSYTTASFSLTADGHGNSFIKFV